MKFPDSALAHLLLDGKKGIEIGPSAHNPFHLDTVSVGHETKDTVYEREEVRLCGEYARLDYVCEGDALPFPDSYFDFVICSHVLEHFLNPIKTLEEWKRVVKPYGLIFVIFPHKERTFDKDKHRTTVADLAWRSELDFKGLSGSIAPPPEDHYTIWIPEDAREFCHAFNYRLLLLQDPDDKVGNGFTFVIQK